MTVRPTFRPPPAEPDLEAGTLVLRDGSRRPLWRVLPEDVRRIEAFFRTLEEGEREEVMASLGLEPAELDRFIESLSGGEGGEAFLVEAADEDRVVAFGAYRLSSDQDDATIALAVSPDHRGAGIGALLLERLAVLAAHRGVDRLIGRALPANEPLVELFRSSGLDVDEEREGDRVTLVTDVRSVAPEAGDGRLRGLGSRVFTAGSLRPLFFPRSVAVIGASRDPSSVGHRILQGLVTSGFQGTVFPVNPKADQVLSIKAYPSIEAIGEAVDLAVVAVPASVVPDVIDECGEVGVRGLVVVTAGFAETGADGRERQDEILEKARANRMRMVGPNCLGLLHTDPEVRLNASFAPQMPPHGSVGLCSQSGALGIAIIALARRLGLGLSSFVSVGNKADVAADDLLEYWEEDASTDVLLFYLESFARPRRFARIARRVGRRKPIVVVKSGRTAAGERAAGSHTAALTAAETAVEALFHQTGIVRADTLEEMFGIARALTDQPIPEGRRFGIVTNAGGPAILCADALEAAGLEVPGLSEEIRGELAEFLPSAAATGNPVDMIASAGPDAYRRAVEVVLSSGEVDGLVAIYTPVGMFDAHAVGDAIVEGTRAARESGDAEGRPVYASVFGGEEDVYGIESGELTIPAYPFPEVLGRVVGKAVGYAEWRSGESGAFPEFEDQQLDAAREICRDALEERGEGWLSVAEAREVLDRAGLDVGEGGVATTPDEAVEIAERVGYPVAVKLASLQIVHKTEFGGVVLGLEDAEAVRDAFSDIESRLEEEGRRDAMQGVLVQPMLAGTAEVMIGMNTDPVFGPVLAFGMGGIHVEILHDVAFRVNPLTDHDAEEMVREIRGYRLLQGYRGHPAGDVAALEEALQRLSRLVDHVEEIDEIDLNPVFALEPGEGYRIADARIRVAPISAKEPGT
ncbi:MAG: GNAT family N-acetyltransferase [Gemmatimonadota bacterium]|nr:GNAT family N-acetyltransferase [Gemmatimonadota bacterium]